MSNIYLSKSRYCKCVQCKKILWLKKYKPECAVQTARDSVLENGTKVGELAKGLFGKYEDVEFNENLNNMIEKTQDDEEHFKLLVDTNSLGFKMWAMRNIDLVEVKRPLALRNEMQEVIKKAMKKYEI